MKYTLLCTFFTLPILASQNENPTIIPISKPQMMASRSFLDISRHRVQNNGTSPTLIIDELVTIPNPEQAKTIPSSNQIDIKKKKKHTCNQQ